MGIWFFGPRKLFANSIKDEFLLLVLGILGGSLYYLAGNRALELTQTSNVALLACLSPLLTMGFGRFFLKSEAPKNPYLLKGSLLALGGVFLILFNGRYILFLNPLGDFLSLLAALSWAFYMILLKRLGSAYSMLFITRKVFFYGIVSLLPFFIQDRQLINWDLFFLGSVFANLLYLGLIASLVCYFLWNTAVKRLGALRASTYVYFSPVVTMIASALILGETITPLALGGAFLILLGLALAERQAGN